MVKFAFSGSGSRWGGSLWTRWPVVATVVSTVLIAALVLTRHEARMPHPLRLSLTGLAPSPPPWPPRLAVFTIATNLAHPQLLALRSVAARYGVNISVVVPAPGPDGKPLWEGAGTKVRLIREFAVRQAHGSGSSNSNSGGDDPLVMFVDAQDVVVRGSEQQLLDAYVEAVQAGLSNSSNGGGSLGADDSEAADRVAPLRWPPPVLFGAEINCYPENASNACGLGGGESLKWYNEHYPAPTAYRFLNSGTLIGPASLVAALTDAHFDRHFKDSIDDQDFWQRILLNDTARAHIAMDTGCRLFNPTIYGWGHLNCQSDTGTWFNNHTASYPYIMHSNGGDKANFLQILQPSFTKSNYPAPGAKEVECP